MRALKKLEDKDQQLNHNEGWSQDVDTKEVIIKPLKRTRIFYRVLSGFLLLILMVIVGWLLLNQKLFFTQDTSVTSVSPQSSSRPFNKRPGTTNQPVETKKASRTTSQHPVEKPSPHPKPSNKTLSPEKNRESPKKSHVKKKTVTTKKNVSIAQSGNYSLDLQAIAWSKDPHKRIAVINGHILREGESIGDISVTRIGADTVLVRNGDTEQTLLFKPR